MDRQEFEVVLETFGEMVAEQYIEPIVKLLDVMVIHLSARSSIDARLLASQLRARLGEMGGEERETPGGAVVARAERLCELLAAGVVAEDALRRLPRIGLRLVWDGDNSTGS